MLGKVGACIAHLDKLGLAPHTYACTIVHDQRDTQLVGGRRDRLADPTLRLDIPKIIRVSARPTPEVKELVSQ
mgnify:CR=1 FL=1